MVVLFFSRENYHFSPGDLLLDNIPLTITQLKKNTEWCGMKINALMKITARNSGSESSGSTHQLF